MVSVPLYTVLGLQDLTVLCPNLQILESPIWKTIIKYLQSQYQVFANFLCGYSHFYSYLILP